MYNRCRSRFHFTFQQPLRRSSAVELRAEFSAELAADYLAAYNHNKAGYFDSMK